ncbi:MAG: ComEC/Rec2 family competence protein [Luteolibacter sp.]
MFAAALVAVLAVGVAKESLVAWGIVSVLVFGAGMGSGSWRRAWGWFLVAVAAGGLLAIKQSEERRQLRSILTVGPLRLEARIVSDPKGDADFWVAAARVLSGPHAGTTLSWRGSGEVPVKGSRVRASGRAAPLPEPRNPGEFDVANWLRQQGMIAVFQADMAHSRVWTDGWASWQAGLRRSFREAVTAGLEETSEAAAVLRAVVIGEMPADAETLVAAYRDSGTLHVFSVSGLHVAMVASMGWVVLRACGVSRRWAVVALLPLVFGYSWLTGNSAPALRSAWMTAVFLGAFALRRQGDLLNVLGTVLLVGALWDGRMIFQPGVQLSYGVVAAIAVGLRVSRSWLVSGEKPELYLPREMMGRWRLLMEKMRKKAAQYFAVSSAACVGSAPLTVWHFGMATPVSILAGIPILPMVYLMLVGGLASAVVYPWVPPLARGINRANGMLAGATTRLAEGFSAIPGGHFSTGNREPFLLVYDLRRGAGAACFSTGKEAVLIDVGDRSGFRSRVTSSLKTLGVAPRTVVLTHPDGRHLGGGEKVWERLPVRQALLPVEHSRSPAFRQWLEEAPKQGVKLEIARVGGKLPLDETTWLEILHAPDPGNTQARADARVAIFRLHWEGWKILFIGDAGTDTEMAMLNAGVECSADVIVCGRPHHDRNLSDAFLRAVSPRAIIASNADYPANERLPDGQIAYWERLGIEVFDQKRTGGVTLKLGKNGELILKGFVDGSEVRLGK